MKNLIFRGMLLLSIIILWYTGLVFYSGPICLWYFYRYQAYDLILLGVFIDIQFWPYLNWPWYSTLAIISFLLMEVLKPYLTVYNKKL